MITAYQENCVEKLNLCCFIRWRVLYASVILFQLSNFFSNFFNFQLQTVGKKCFANSSLSLPTPGRSWLFVISCKVSSSHIIICLLQVPLSVKSKQTKEKKVYWTLRFEIMPIRRAKTFLKTPRAYLFDLPTSEKSESEGTTAEKIASLNG